MASQSLTPQPLFYPDASKRRVATLSNPTWRVAPSHRGADLPAPRRSCGRRCSRRRRRWRREPGDPGVRPTYQAGAGIALHGARVPEGELGRRPRCWWWCAAATTHLTEAEAREYADYADWGRGARPGTIGEARALPWRRPIVARTPRPPPAATRRTATETPSPVVLQFTRVELRASRPGPTAWTRYEPGLAARGEHSS